MTDPESTLVFITCLVGAVCGIAVLSRRGVIYGSARSHLNDAAKKYVQRPGKRNQFYLYLGIAFIVALLVALLSTRDLKLIAFFVGFNSLSIGYFLSYFVLLEPKDKSK